MRSLISDSDTDACVPGGDPRRARRRDIMDLIGSSSAWIWIGIGTAAAAGIEGLLFISDDALELTLVVLVVLVVAVVAGAA